MKRRKLHSRKGLNAISSYFNVMSFQVLLGASKAVSPSTALGQFNQCQQHDPTIYRGDTGQDPTPGRTPIRGRSPGGLKN